MSFAIRTGLCLAALLPVALGSTIPGLHVRHAALGNKSLAQLMDHFEPLFKTEPLFTTPTERRAADADAGDDDQSDVAKQMEEERQKMLEATKGMNAAEIKIYKQKQLDGKRQKLMSLTPGSREWTKIDAQLQHMQLRPMAQVKFHANNAIYFVHEKLMFIKNERINESSDTGSPFNSRMKNFFITMVKANDELSRKRNEENLAAGKPKHARVNSCQTIAIGYDLFRKGLPITYTSSWPYWPALKAMMDKFVEEIDYFKSEILNWNIAEAPAVPCEDTIRHLLAEAQSNYQREIVQTELSAFKGYEEATIEYLALALTTERGNDKGSSASTVMKNAVKHAKKFDEFTGDCKKNLLPDYVFNVLEEVLVEKKIKITTFERALKVIIEAKDKCGPIPELYVTFFDDEVFPKSNTLSGEIKALLEETGNERYIHQSKWRKENLKIYRELAEDTEQDANNVKFYGLIATILKKLNLAKRVNRLLKPLDVWFVMAITFMLTTLVAGGMGVYFMWFHGIVWEGHKYEYLSEMAPEEAA